jgi:hypothetical protein
MSPARASTTASARRRSASAKPAAVATTITNGINVVGSKVTATAFGADVVAQGRTPRPRSSSTPARWCPELRNTGTITATLTGGAQDARAVVDLSGSLTRVLNTGVITATVAPKIGSTNVGQAVALDLRANTTGAMTVSQTKLTSRARPTSPARAVRVGQ